MTGWSDPPDPVERADPAGPVVDWPVWSVQTDPEALGRYVLPNVVAQHVAIPEPSGEAPLTRLRMVWQQLREVGIGYAHERVGSGAAGQWIRSPAELLVAPRNGTCLDLAVLLAGACQRAGLPAAIVVLDPTAPGHAGHALVAVLLAGSWPAGSPEEGVWRQPPEGFLDAVRASRAGPPRDIVVLDPNGLAHTSGASRMLGTDADLADAVAAGYRHVTAGELTWRLGVVARQRGDAFVPAPMPKVRPLREIYGRLDTAESALRLLRAEYQVTPFQSRDELTVLLDFCEQVRAAERTGLAVVHGAGGSGKTRLVLELADRLRTEGWYAGPLREKLADADPASLPWLAQVSAPLLVVVDYADARVGEALAALKVIAGRAGPAAVMVLTGRSTDGDWLETIIGGLTTDAHAHQVEILPLPDARPRPWDVYRRAAEKVGGLEDALTELATQDTAQRLLQEWISTQTWEQSFEFLRQHEQQLRQPEVAALLSHSDEPVVRQHAAILELTSSMPARSVLDIVTDTATAADEALSAIERADLQRLQLIVHACPKAQREPGKGLLLLAVLLMAAGHPQEALQLTTAVAASLTDLQRRARAVNLRRLAAAAATADLPDLATAVQPLITALTARPTA